MKFILNFLLSNFKWYLFSMFLLVFIGQILESLEPYALKLLLDIESKENIFIARNYIEPLLFLCILRLTSLLTLRGNQLIDSFFSPRCKTELQTSLYKNILLQPISYFNYHSTGKIAQLISECSRITLLLLEIFIIDILRGIVLLTGAITVLSTQEFIFSLLLLLWAIFHICISYHLSLICVKYSRIAAEHSTKSFSWIVDGINNIEVLKDYSAEEYELEKLTVAQKDEVKHNSKLKLFTTYTRIFQSVSVSLLFSGLLGACLYLKNGEHGIAGSFALVASISTMISFQFWNISNRLVVLVENFGILQQAISILLLPPPKLSGKDINLCDKENCSIEFKNVNFGYEKNISVLSNLNFKIQAGERVALAGPSGSGKTTIAKLLQRHIDVCSGGIFIDGINLADISVNSIRNAITIVNQSPSIFHRSVIDNIQYGAMNSTYDDVKSAAKLAHAHKFIIKRPNKYNTIVGERGSQFSGGQKQRIALSRALLKPSPILILDEATSALDIDTEEAIQRAINDTSGKKTVIVIAHRLSTISMMDRIIYLEDGRVLEEGTHDTLINLKGKYFHLWNVQVQKRMKNDAIAC